MLRNTTGTWGLATRVFHWLMAAMIAAQVPLGFWMTRVYDETIATKGDFAPLLRISMVHHTMGFLILILVTARLAWRMNNPTPALPPGLAAYQHSVARLTHVFLYALLFTFPLTGWAALSAYEGKFPIFFFAWDSMPRLVPQSAKDGMFSYEFFAEIHQTCWKLGAFVLSLHVAGALWHHFVAKDGVLTRMLRGPGRGQTRG